MLEPGTGRATVALPTELFLLENGQFHVEYKGN